MNYAGKFAADVSHSNARFDFDLLSHRGDADTVTIPNAHLLFSGDYERSGADLIVSDRDHRVVVPDYFHGAKRPTLVSPEGAPLDPKVIEALTGHVAYAQAAGTAAAAKLLGHVVKMTGSASIVRNGVTVDVNNGDNIYQNDVVQTGSGSTLGLVLIDGTTFNLTANARLMLNDLVYEANSTSNTSLFTLVQGAASFVAGQVAKTGDMKVATPVASIGIRGTAVILDISSTDGTVSISVVDQQDNQVHAVQVFNTRGDLIGTVTSNGTSLTLTPTATFEVIAQESNKTPAQVAQEFNAFQQVLSTYDVGKQIAPNTPPPTDGRRGDANPQSTTKFAGSPPISPTEGTSTHFNAPVGGNTTGQGTTVESTTQPSSNPTPAAGPIIAVVTPNDTTPPLIFAVAPTTIPFVVTPPPISRVSSGGGDHFGPVMSADGQFVTYDPDGAIFLFDRQSGITSTIASPSGGFTYSAPTISADGHYISYQGSNGTQSYVYIYNNNASDAAHYQHTTLLVAGGVPAISGDGSTIVVEQGGTSIGVYDQHGHAIATITPAALGQSGAVWRPAISGDGHVIAFWSSDSATPGGSGQLFTYDLSTGTVAAIASTATGAGTSAASLSADGHYVVYQSDAPGGHSEIYLYDLTTGQVIFQTANAAGGSYNPVISPDGHFIIFASDAQLTSDDTNSVADTYVVDVTDPSHAVFKLVSALADGTPGNAASNLGASISAGGLFVAFGSSASNLSTTGTAGAGDIFVVDPTSGHSAIIQESASSPSLLTASGVIELTGGSSSGVTLSVSDQSGKFTAAFDSNGNIQWNFSEQKSDFAFLKPGQLSSQDFVITLSTNISTTTIPVKVSVFDADQPTIAVADAAPVASFVNLPQGKENAPYTVTAAALLAGVADIDGPSLSITAVTVKSGGGTIVDNLDGTWTYTPATGFVGTVVLNYTASDGTLSSNSSTASLDLVSIAPTVAIDTAGGITNQSVQTISGIVVSGGATVGGTLTLYDNGSTTPLGTADVGSDGSWTAQVTLSGDGVHSIVAADTDTAGNTGTSTPVSFTLDTVPPSEALAITAIATDSGSSSSDFTTNDTTLIVSGTNGALGSGEKIQVSSDGSAWHDVVPTGSTSWSYDDTATVHSTSFTYQARIVDTAGNIGTTASQAVTIDTTAPTAAVAITAIAPDTGTSSSDFNTSATSLTVSGTNGTLGSGEKVQVSTNGTTWADVSQTDATHWSYADPATHSSSFTYQARIVDTAGNVDLNTASQAVTIDTTAPTATIAISAIAPDTGASSSDFNTSATSLTVSGTNGTLGSGEKVQVSTNGTTWADVSQTDATHWSYADPATHGSNFTYQARIVDTAGNVDLTTASQAVTIDTTAPVVSITTAGGPTNQAAQTISGTVDVADIGTTVTLFDNGPTPLATATVGSGGLWSTSVTLLGNGTHSIVAKDTDVAGNTGTSAPVIFTLSTIGPILTENLATDTGSSASDKVTSNDALTGTSDANALVTLTEGTTVLGTTTSNGAGVWSFTPTGLLDGTHTIVASQTDAFGNTGTAALTFMLDTTAPVAPTIASVNDNVSPVTGNLTSGAHTNDTDLTVQVSLTGTGAFAGDRVQLYNGSTTGSQLGTSYTITATDISNGFANVQTGTLTDGTTYAITARVTDSAGNQSGASGSFSVTEDTTAPNAPTITSVTDDVSPVTGTLTSGASTNDTDLTVKVTLPTTGSLAVAGDTVQLFNGAGSLGSSHVLTGADITAGFVNMQTGTLTDGTTYTITAKITDAAGNVSNASASFTVTEDTTAPNAPTITSVTDDVAPVTGALTSGARTNDTDLTVKVTLPTTGSLAVAGDTVQLFNGAGSLGSSHVLTGADITAGFVNMQTGTLTDGTTYTITAKITDAAGNVSNASAGFTVTEDTTAPAAPTGLTLDASTDSGTVGDNKTNVQAVKIDGSAEAGSTVTLYDGLTVIGTGTATGGTFSITTSALSQGSHTITAKATDAAGNTGAASTGYALTIDTTAPTETLAITSIAGSSSPTDTTITVSGSNGALATGDKIQISSNNGTTWTDVVQNSATTWSFADSITHTANFTYRTRIVDTAANVGATATQAVLVANNGGTVLVAGSSAFVTEFTGTGGNLQLGPSPGITGTVNAISVATGPVAIGGSGSVTSGTGDAIDLTATGGTQANPANLSISPSGPITGAASGISAVQNASGSITITTSGPVIGQAGRGIFAQQSVTGVGSILINGSGNVTGTGNGFSGIVAQNLNTANSGNVTVSQTGDVSGGRDGIRAQTNGNGTVTVTTGALATITATQLYGIEAVSSGQGNIVVTTGSGVINSGSVGINAYNQATSIPQVGGVTVSSISISANGTINSGSGLTLGSSRPAGILAGYKGGTTNTTNPAVFGNVKIDNFANINAAGGDGIRAYNFGSGNVTVNDHSGAIVAKDEFGISASTNGIGNVSISTLAANSITSGSSGIQAINLATAIPVGAASTVTVVTATGTTINSGTNLTPGGAQPQGISAGYFPGNVGVSNTSVNGSVVVDNFANITAAAGWGINAYNFGNGSVQLTDEGGTSVSGAQFGIAASSSSSGSSASGGVTINVGASATISAGQLYGLAAIQATESNVGNISITTSTGDTINSGGLGIQANNSANPSTNTSSSQISITTLSGTTIGTISTISSGFDMSTNGNQPGGIWAGYNPGGQGMVNPNVHGNVVVDNAANINAASGVGIGLYNFGVGNLSAIIEASSTISAISAGVNAFAQGGGNVTITNGGTLSASSGSGIIAGTGNGLATTGAGTILISNAGTISAPGSANNSVIQINNNSSHGATFTNSGTVTAKLFSASSLNVAVGANNGNIATNTGAVTVNNTGTISGNVALGTSPFNISGTTFNNNIGGVWNVNGSNWFGGLANTINNSGAINIAAFSAFYPAVGSTFTLSNSGTVNVLANSAAYIGAAVSGSGSFIINNRAELEFAGSVAGGLTGQTVSFAAGVTGVLTLDNPLAFNGTIANLAIGDTIDFLGASNVTSASISPTQMTVTINGQNQIYTVSSPQSGTMFNVLSSDKIVLVPTSATIQDSSSAPYNAFAAGFYIFSHDAITGNVNGIDINASADSNPAHYVSVDFNQTSSIVVLGSAIAVNLTTGIANIALVNAGSLSGGIGINTTSTSGSTDIIDYGNVSGAQYAIDAHITTGLLNIVVGGGAIISSSTSYGIFAGTTFGALDVTTIPGTTITSGSAGILAQDQWSGAAQTGNSISIANSGAINSGGALINLADAPSGTPRAPAGIRAGILNGTTATPNPNITGDVSVTNLANINAAAGSGIYAFNYGSGNVSVSSDSSTIVTSIAPVTPGTGSAQYGIFAFNYGKGSSTVTTGFGSTINSGSTGINAGNQSPSIAPGSGSTVTVVAQGAINSGINSNNSGGAPSGIQAGYNPSGGQFNPSVFGDVFVIDNANINAAAGDGINAYNYGVGNISVNLGFNASIVALVSATSSNVNGNAPFGIGAFNYGHGDVHVTTSGGDSIQSGSSGINASNQWHPTTPDQGFALVTVSAAGSIHSGSINNNSSATALPSGITAGFLGSTSPTQNLNLKGNVIVNNAANITADAGYGINAYNYGNGGITVNEAAGTTVSGVQYGIDAHAEAVGGTGNIAINVYSGATINSTVSYGIFAFSNDIGNISIITSPGDVINSGSVGIDAVNEAPAIDASAGSSIVVTAAGTINSGTNLTGTNNQPGGIIAGYLGPAPGGIITTTFPLTAIHGDVVVNNSATINAAGGDGIRAYNYGIGDVTINELAGTITALDVGSSTPGFGIGIVATNQGSGNIHISTAAGTVINSGSSGIVAVNKAPSSGSFVVPSTSEISVLALGTIHSGSIPTATVANDPAAGILAGYNPNNSNTPDINVHGNVSIDDYASILAPAGTDGIRGVNYGTGTIAIIAEAGATINAGRYGIAAFGYDGGNVSVTNYATVTGGTAAIDATTTAAGNVAVSIDNYGTILGNVISGNVTFHNELGALWYLAGNSTFATVTDALINDGTINVLSGSLDVAAAVTGSGSITIGNGVTLEFGSSVATGETISFLGTNGTIKLDHSLPTPFLGQISNLNGTALNYDTLDLADLTWTGTASAQYIAANATSGTLTVSDGNGHIEGFNLINYTGSGHFVTQDDLHGGTIVVDNQAPSIAGDMAVAAVKGGSVTLTTTDLSAVDPVVPAQQLVYTVLGTSHGHLQLGNNPVTTFTLQDIQSGLVSFVTNDPSYTGQGSFTVSLSDGLPGVATQVARVGVYIVDAQFRVLTTGGYNFDQDNAIVAMGTGVVSLVTPTTFTITNTVADRDFVFTGSGFAYDSVNHLFTAGTITSILEKTDSSQTQLANFDLNVLAALWMNAVIDKANGGRVIESLVNPWTFNFIGNTGADAFGASSQNDVFTGNGGNDNFDGQFGYDRASYRNATGPINVQLAAGIVIGDPSVGTDTLKSIELVTGTNFADTFDATGFSATSTNAGSTVTSNTAGFFNEFEGDAGNDTITGNGQTRISYFHATAGVTVIFNPVTSWATPSSGASGIATGDSSVGTDTFTGVNNVRGSFFNDTFIGSNNPSGTVENFEGLGGNDLINGGGGFDRAVYSQAADNTGIIVNLAAGIVTGGPDTGTDTLLSVEAIWGTNFADTYDATGFTATSTNAGSAGVNGNGAAFNEFEGDGGNDTITGNGNTRVAYYHATGGVVVTLGLNGSGTADGNITVGHDTIISGVNAVRGSEFNDVITGNGDNNTLEGLNGNDVLDGGGGNDTLTGGPGSDIFVYKPGYGVTTITDFSHASADRIDLRAFSGIHSLSDLTFSVSGTTLTITSVAGGFNDGTHKIVVQGYDSVSNPVTASDFIFNAAAGSSVAVTVQTPDGYDFSTLYNDMAASSLATSADTPDHIFAVDAAKGITFEMIGTGFTYDATPQHLPLTGTITEIDILNTIDPTQTTQDHVLVNTNGWSIDAATFFSDIGAYAANNNNTAGLNGIFNAATYSIVGSAGSADNNSGPHDGADVFFGGDHADVFNGMPGPFGPFDPGNDTVDYSHASAGVTANLLNPASNTGAAAGDVYISIENLRGTNFDDTLTGDGNNNVLEGGLGTNTLDGGGGFDIASYEHATGPVTVSLAASGPQPTGAGIDTLVNIEGLRGSSFNDTLTGNGNSVLEGGPGNDILIGQAGQNDTASYEHATSGVTVNLTTTGQQDTHGAGLDTLTNIANLSGSHFNDILTGDTHNNTFFGNGGQDTFVFNETSGGIGHDTIGDFMSGQDHIKLDYAAFNPSDAISFSAWLASHVMTVNGGSDLLIDLNVDGNHPGQDTILLKNASFGGLHANDFILP